MFLRRLVIHGVVMAMASSVLAFSQLRRSQTFSSPTRFGSRINRFLQSSQQADESNPADPFPTTLQPSPKLIEQQRQMRNTSSKPLFSSIKMSSESPSWNVTLRSAANWASLLCVLDCTILPILSVVTPLVGWLNFGTVAFQETLCVWSHRLALYFVLPVGMSTTAINYSTGHRNRKVAAIGSLGLLLIAACNGGWIPALHHGLLHRLVNVLGCTLLLGSNYLSQQLGCDCGIPFCKPKILWKRGGARTSLDLATALLQVPKKPSTSSQSSSPMAMQTRMVQYKHGNKPPQNKAEDETI